MNIENIFQLVRNNEVDEFEHHLASINVNIKNSDGQSLLHEAVVYDNLIIIERVIKQKIDINSTDKRGQTPLHYCALYNRLEFAKIIIKVGGNVNIVDSYGNNALWTATFNARGNYKIVQLFVNAKGDSINLNNNGKSALDFAKQIQDKKLIQILNAFN